MLQECIHMKYFALALTMAVCLGITVLVIKKPVLNLSLIKYKGRTIRAESFWVAALTIPVIFLTVGAITPTEVLRGITSSQSMNPLKILVLFMSMCFISVMLDKAGFFEYCAMKVMSRPGKGQFHLFVVFYAVVSVLTVFTSNDIIILTFTPFIYYFAKNAGINPLPYIIAEFVAANTWSLVLMIGNPTNIYIASSMGITFIEYFKVMALPGVAAGLSSFLMLILIFRRHLKLPLREQSVAGKTKLKDKTMAILSLADLALCVIALTFCSYIDMEMWIVSLLFVALLLIAALMAGVYRRQKQEKESGVQNYVRIKDVFKGLPYSVIPFLLSMFIAVLTLKKHGITDDFSNVLFSVADSTLGTGILFGFASVLCSNIINNIPMSIFFASILNAAGSGSYLTVAVYSTIIGSNIGAFFSPIGALAGVMLMKILKDKGDGFTALSFIRYCAPVAVVSLSFSVLVLIFLL